jgi:hypothetical protein
MGTDRERQIKRQWHNFTWKRASAKRSKNATFFHGLLNDASSVLRLYSVCATETKIQSTGKNFCEKCKNV